MLVVGGTASLSMPNNTPGVPSFGRNGTVMVSCVDAFGNVVTALSASYVNLGQATGQVFGP